MNLAAGEAEKHVLKGDICSGLRIVVGRAVAGRSEETPMTSLDLCNHVVLPFKERMPEDVALATNSDTLYVTVSFNNGVFDVTTLGASDFAAPDETRISGMTPFHRRKFPDPARAGEVSCRFRRTHH